MEKVIQQGLAYGKFMKWCCNCCSFSDLSTKNLQYLTSQQALADLATFIAAMNDKYKFSENVRWIAFGGSYPGSLAAWLRAKYPFLIRGAMSASGPLLAEVDFSGKVLAVNNDYAICYDSASNQYYFLTSIIATIFIYGVSHDEC